MEQKKSRINFQESLSQLVDWPTGSFLVLAAQLIKERKKIKTKKFAKKRNANAVGETLVEFTFFWRKSATF